MLIRWPRVGGAGAVASVHRRCAHTLRAVASALDGSTAAFEPPRARGSPFSGHIEDTRVMRVFTEETKRFRVPVMGRSQEELAIATTAEDDALHVLTQHPFGLHSFTNVSRGASVREAEHRFTNLHSVVPFGTPVPFLAALPYAQIVTFCPELACLVRLDQDRELGSLHYMDEDDNNRRMSRFGFGYSYFGRVDKSESGGRGRNPDDWGVNGSLSASDGIVVVHEKGERQLHVFDFKKEVRVDIELPDDDSVVPGGIKNVACTSMNEWVLTARHEENSGGSAPKGRYIIKFHDGSMRAPTLRYLAGPDSEVAGWSGEFALSHLDPGLPPPHLSFDSSARFSAAPEDTYYATARLGEEEVEVFASLREEKEPGGFAEDVVNSAGREIVFNRSTAPKNRSYFLSNTNLLAKSVHSYKLSEDFEGDDNEDGKHNDKSADGNGTVEVYAPSIELVDSVADAYRSIDASLPREALVLGANSPTTAHELRRTMADRMNPAILDMTEVIGSGEVATLQVGGWIRLWETDSVRLKNDLQVWMDMHGRYQGKAHEGGELQITGTSSRAGAGGERTQAPELEMPKHGKESDGKQHVGGNTWAGGTGGSNTAGLGGRGGPYRLDGGHPVHQVTQELKDEVSDEARAQARAMAEAAFQQRLEDIEMGEAENETYQSYFSRVHTQVAQLSSVLENVRARAKERTWLKHTTYGELDDAKIVDGAAGERNVYKRRGSEESAPGSPQRKPKQLRFVLDVSGSMYRFNGQDGRLDRMLEAAVMIMTALDGMESRFQYGIVGHSGDGPDIQFVVPGHPPEDRAEQLRILQKMVAHTQFCMSGDSTFEAAELAIQEVAQQDGDEAFVFVVSDANLRRYGLSPHELGAILTSEPKVNACAIFIASLADEAARIEAALPPGTGHVCFDTAELPQLFRQLFQSNFDDI